MNKRNNYLLHMSLPPSQLSREGRSMRLPCGVVPPVEHTDSELTMMVEVAPNVSHDDASNQSPMSPLSS